MKTYLDNAATTLQKPASVYPAVANTMRTCASHGRGGHSASMEAAKRIYDCRTLIAQLFSLEEPERVAFTYNATVALNLAIKALIPDGGHAVISSYEHNAVVRPLAALARRGVRYTVASAPLFQPKAQLDAFTQAITKDTSLVVCNHVSNVFGYVLPIYDIDALCAAHGIPLIIDAAQSAGAVPLDVSRLRATAFVCMPGHKGLYGPQGTGAMLCLRDDLRTQTLIEGGTGSDSASPEQPAFLPDRFESGTHNTPGIAGLAEGVRFVLSRGVDAIAAHEHTLLHTLTDGLRDIPGIELFEDRTGVCQSGVLSLRVASVPPEQAAAQLATLGIAVRAGLHCAPLAHKAAGTLEGGTVRASFSAFSTPRDVARLVHAMRVIAKHTH